jgi:hypothetical protein
MAKLKVFRTPIGFHDAYIAAASQKAALQAWGADADLFARGIAERVDDPGLMKEPLERPGEVIKVRRGSAADHFKLIERRPTKPPKKSEKPVVQALSVERSPTPPKKTRPRPRPSRATIERAEALLQAIDAELEEQLKVLAAQERAIKEQRQALKSTHAARRDKAQPALARAQTIFREKIEKWATR